MCVWVGLAAQMHSWKDIDQCHVQFSVENQYLQNITNTLNTL